jgi:hypothetical protein
MYPFFSSSSNLGSPPPPQNDDMNYELSELIKKKEHSAHTLTAFEIFVKKKKCGVCVYILLSTTNPTSID